MKSGYEAFKEFIQRNGLEAVKETGFTKEGVPFVDLKVNYHETRVCVYASGEDGEILARKTEAAK